MAKQDTSTVKKGGKNVKRAGRQASMLKGSRPRRVRNALERKIARVRKSCGNAYADALRHYLITRGYDRTKHTLIGAKFMYLRPHLSKKKE